MWNVDHPDRVTAVHAAYVNAGSDIVLTNSFGGTGFRLKLHKLDDRCIELNRAAAQVARTAADAHFAETGRRVLVAG
jgi:5-methyltetrahydrofolate--homocysteine methyltransferase